MTIGHLARLDISGRLAVPGWGAVLGEQADMGCWVGADPGGKDSFGVALLDASGGLELATVSSVDEAVDRIVSRGEPLGLGIDAPMWWSSDGGGRRKADERIRKRYGIHPGTVQSVNSLRGAALVGSAMLAFRIRQRFPGARITEAHPKALLKALELDEHAFAERFGISTGWCNEHERDGAIAAVCAREGFEGRWPADLTEQRHRPELDPQSYCLAPMRYFWPEPV